MIVNQSEKPQQTPRPSTNYRTTNSHFRSYNNYQTYDKTTSYYKDTAAPSSTTLRPSPPTPPHPTTTFSTTTTSTTPPPAPYVSQTTTYQQNSFSQNNYQQQPSSPAQDYNPYETYNNLHSTKINQYSQAPFTTTTSTTTTPRPIQQSRQSYYPSSTSAPIAQFSVNDDIFRGSYSSNFFNNRNNGKEDFDSEFADKKAITTKATQKPANRGRGNRGRVTYNSSQRGQDNFNVIGNVQRPVTTTYQTTAAPVTTTPKPSTPLNRVQNANSGGRNYDTIRTSQQRTQTANIAPVTYRPQSSQGPAAPRSTVAKLNASPSTASPINPEDQFYDVPRKQPVKPAAVSYTPSTTRLFESSTPQQKYNPNANYDLTAVQQSQFTYNPYGEPRVSPSYQSSTSSSFLPTTTTTTTQAPLTNPPKIPFFPTPAPQQASSPRGFEIIPITLQPQGKPLPSPERPQPFSRRSDSRNNTPSTIKKFSTLVPRELYDPTTFKPSTYKKPVDNLAAIKSAQLELNKQRDTKYSSSNYLPTTTTTTTTTAQPSTYKPVTASPVQYSTYQSTQSPFTGSPASSFGTQPVSQFNSNQNNNFNSPSTSFQQQSSPAFAPKTNFRSTISQNYYSTPAPSYSQSFFPTSTIPPRNLGDIDENDGQYHPELYEKDFARYKIKNKQPKSIVATAAPYTIQSTAASSINTVAQQINYQKPVAASSGEEEFLKTAHSQNIVASGNQLLYDQIKNGQIKQQLQQQQSPKPVPTIASPRPFSKTAPTIPPNASTRRPAKANAEKDVSYDYQYYDLGADSSPRDYEFDLLEDFGKIKKIKGKKQ